jgi:hypothetical protein
MTSEHATRKSGELWLQATLVTVFFSALMIRQSMQHGRLALPPTFDDVSYLNEGANYLSTFDSQGFVGVLKAYLAGPPHAPISTGAALAGFALLGIHDWVGAVTDAIVLLLFSRLYLGVGRDLTVIQSTLLLAVLWTSPFVGITLIWFRPDMIASLLVAVGAIYVVTRTDWVTNRRAQLTAAAFCGGSLWAKPAIFPLTLALFGAAVALASLSAIRKREFLKVISAGAAMFAVAVLIALPYYAFSFDTIVSYIHTVMFGSQADIWVHPLPPTEALGFYLTGYYGQISIGWWLYGGIVVGFLALILLFLKSDTMGLRASLRVIALLIVTYAAVTIPTFKGPHGFPFAAMVLVAVSLALIVVARKLPRVIATSFCGFALIVSLWQFEWQFTKDNSYVTIDLSSRRRAVVAEILNIIGNNVKDKNILFSTSSNFSNFSTLDFEYKQRGIATPQWTILHLNGDIAEQKRQIPSADLVVAYTADFTDTIPNLPTSTPEFREKFIEAVEQTGLFCDPATVNDEDAHGAILIFKKCGHG